MRRLARTAHDVRHLLCCEHCNDLADDRDAVRAFHPKCFYERFGEAEVLALPADERGKFRLCDVPAETMKKLIGKA